jgi:hypothetical protein
MFSTHQNNKGKMKKKGDRDQENYYSKSALANSLLDPISKIPTTKQDCWSGLSDRASA